MRKGGWIYPDLVVLIILFVWRCVRGDNQKSVKPVSWSSLGALINRQRRIRKIRRQTQTRCE